jgi:hypothetical protein
MLKKLTTVLGLTLVAGSLAFASQTPSTNPDQAATKPPAAQATPSDPQQQPATTSKSVKKHKRHHKKHAASNVAPNSSTPKQ